MLTKREDGVDGGEEAKCLQGRLFLICVPYQMSRLGHFSLLEFAWDSHRKVAK